MKRKRARKDSMRSGSCATVAESPGTTPESAETQRGRDGRQKVIRERAKARREEEKHGVDTKTRRWQAERRAKETKEKVREPRERAKARWEDAGTAAESIMPTSVKERGVKARAREY